MKKTFALLLALVLALSLALPAFAFPSSDEGDGRDETFGIAKGYVRTKESRKEGENAYLCVRTYNKQGKLTKETVTNKGVDYTYTSTTTNTYDKKGNLTKEVIAESDYTNVTTRTYNSKGKVTKEVRKITYEDNSTFLSTRTYTYDKAGNLTKELAYYDDCEDLTTYTYNKAGDVTKQVQTQKYEDNTQDQTTQTWTYDKKGNETKWTMTEKDRYGGSEKRTRVSAYNQKNLCTKMTETWSFINNDGSTGKTTDVTTYTYDKKGHVTKETFKQTFGDGSVRLLVFVNTFDEKGNKIKVALTEKSDGYNIKSTTTYTYKNKRLVKEVTVSKDEDGTSKTTETYTYDKAGNLTKYDCVYRYSDGSGGKETTTYAYQKIGK